MCPVPGFLVTIIAGLLGVGTVLRNTAQMILALPTKPLFSVRAR
jgi:hypothetical protein